MLMSPIVKHSIIKDAPCLLARQALSTLRNAVIEDAYHMSREAPSNNRTGLRRQIAVMSGIPAPRLQTWRSITTKKMIE